MKGRVYKIVTSVDDKIYVGSTTTSIKRRFVLHKSQYRRWLKRLTAYTASFDLFEDYGVENCKIVLIEELEITNRTELLIRENYWIDQLKNVCVNKQPAFSSQEKKKKDMNKAALKYYYKNKDELLIKNREYLANKYAKNKDYFLEKCKEWAKGKKHCIYCDQESNRGHFSLHVKTIKHQKNVEFFENVFND